MDFDSPDVAKEFPGLYMGDAGKTLNDPAEYEEDEKSKRKKDKKDSKKDKGYAALAGESSHDEEELDPKSPGKAKKIKASFKLSAKRKDKKSVDKPDKERKNSDKEKEKSKKLDKDKKSIDKDVSSKEDTKSDKKSLDKEKIHVEKEKDKHKEKEKKSVEKDKEKKSGEKDKDKKKEEKKKKLSIGGDKETHLKTSVGTSSPSNTEKEKEKGTLNLNQALNAFLNAPAPLLMKSKDKEHKKEKDSTSTSSKVKLKLKRSKNSLEDSQSSQSDLPFTVTHQFPEDPDAIAKEIRKYEALLEQTHSHMKSSKKISKKSEEQLWELQRTLTQLKRKLRSINALSVGSPASVPTCQQPSLPAVSTTAKLDSVQPIPANNNNNSAPKPEEVLKKPEEIQPVVPVIAKSVENVEEMKLDFTLKTIIPPPPSKAKAVQATKSVDSDVSVNGSNSTITSKTEATGTMSPLKQEFDLNPSCETNNKLSPNVISEQGSSNSNLTSSLTPEAEVERLQVEVQIHAQNETPVAFDESDEERNDIATPDFSNNDYTMSASIIKTLTFSEDEDDDVIEEITDVSSLSLRNTNIENENSFLDENVDMTRSKISQATIAAEIDPFEMPIFETEEYLAIENEALIFFNEELQEEIAREETEIEDLMKQLEQMSHNGVDIDAPEIDLDLDQFEFEELVSLWQITKLENEALNEQVHHLRQMVALSKLEEFRLETRLKYLEEKTLSGRNCPAIPPLQDADNYTLN